MTPDEAIRRYAELDDQRQAGQLGEAALATAMAELRFQGADGVWWQVDPGTGGWLTWTGSSWTPATRPPTPVADHVLQCPQCQTPVRAGLRFCSRCGAALGQTQAPTTGAGLAVTAAAMAARVTSEPARRGGRVAGWGQRVWDVITMLGCSATAGAWYVYSGLAETQPDYRTCVTIVVLPLALIVLRPLIDRLLLPLKPLRQKVPPLVRLGIGLALPLLVSNYLYRTGNSQFDFLFKTVLISTLGSYVILRNPVPPQLQTLQREAGR